MRAKQKRKIGNNKAFICIKENNQLVLKPVDLFGSVRVIVGEKTEEGQIARLVHDLRQQDFKTFLRLELATGGAYLEEFNGYKNWFPGSTTYGFIREHDATLYNQDGSPMQDIFGNTLYVPMGGQGGPKEESTVEILDILDGVKTDSYLQRKLNIHFHVKTASGVVGYISAQNVTDIYYKVKYKVKD